MAWSDLPANTMISRYWANRSPFSKIPGQEQLDNDKQLTKSEILLGYNVSASAMASYADNQLVPKSAWVSGSVTSYTYQFTGGYGTAVQACADLGFAQYLFSDSPFLGFGVVLYSNAGLTATFNGANAWRRCSDDNLSYRINSSGNIIATAFCDQ